MFGVVVVFVLAVRDENAPLLLVEGGLSELELELELELACCCCFRRDPDTRRERASRSSWIRFMVVVKFGAGFDDDDDDAGGGLEVGAIVVASASTRGKELPLFLFLCGSYIVVVKSRWHFVFATTTGTLCCEVADVLSSKKSS